jgi:hypothetical protein
MAEVFRRIPWKKAWKRASLFIFLIVMLSCSADIDSMVLFQADPGIQNIPPNVELEQIVGRAPPAQFSRLQYENHLLDKITGKTSLPYTSSVNLKAQDRQIAVTKTEYFISQPDGSFSKQVTDVDVGVPGIISFVYLTTKQSPPRQIQFRKVARRLEEVTGRLFPLDNGSLLSFNIVFAYQVTRGSKTKPAQDLVWSYRFQKIGHYEGYTLPDRTVSGKIYIIARRVIDPEGGIDNTLIHFAESIGAAIKTVRQGEEFIEETRLVSMETSLTDP